MRAFAFHKPGHNSPIFYECLTVSKGFGLAMRIGTLRSLAIAQNLLSVVSPFLWLRANPDLSYNQQ